MCSVLPWPAATAIKVNSRDQAHRRATIKGSRIRWPRRALNSIRRSRTRFADVGLDRRSRTRFADPGRDSSISDSIRLSRTRFVDLGLDSPISDAIRRSRTRFVDLGLDSDSIHRSRTISCLAVGVTNNDTVCIAHALNINHMFLQHARWKGSKVDQAPQNVGKLKE